MDGIQPYSGAPRPLANQPITASLKLPKSASDYFLALRRRAWLVLAVGVPLSVLGAILTLRQAAIYRVTAEISIEPPRFDPALATLVTHDVARRDIDAIEKYVPNRLAQLRSKSLAERVVNDPELFPGSAPVGGDPAQDLVNSLQVRQMPGTNYFVVSLEGTDPERIRKQLEALLGEFRKQAEDEVLHMLNETQASASRNLELLRAEETKLREQIFESLKNSKTIAPGGKNILVERHENLGLVLMQKRMMMHDIQQQALVAQLFPNIRGRGEFAAIDNQLIELESIRRKLTGRLKSYRSSVRSSRFNTDPSVKFTAEQLNHVLDEIKDLKSRATETAANPSEFLLDSMREEILQGEKALEVSLAQLQASAPEHEKFLNSVEDRKQKVKQIAEMEQKLSEFKFVSTSQKMPIKILSNILEPTTPVRPNRAVNLAIGVLLSFGLGLGLVCLLEYLDHSVKVPEHLSYGLTLPLFGVVPRMRRVARIQRGGHLWTPGAPESVEADAYRNLRAGLLGVSVKRGPIVTLLVTSAKAGEGKSTTALNLAATCARAGERTLLVDVDLRRPSLADVFRGDDEEPHHLGLTDVLRGDLPWQRTVVRTDLPNLDFLPTGDTRDIPIEILGSLELRQLMIALANHYDRVILDGPAILGLADCRMLGRVVDAALLVVRSGLHELRPLQRAKAMLEQSHVVIAGVVFNALFEDLKNWSSYGPGTPYGSGDGPWGQGRSLDDAADFEGPSGEQEHAALPLGGSHKV